MPETTFEPINITWTQVGADSYNWTIPANAVEAITALTLIGALRPQAHFKRC